MASIREHIETVFAALAFAERNLEQQAKDFVDQAPTWHNVSAPVQKRSNTRPRVRV